MKPTLSVSQTSNSKNLLARLSAISSHAAYVGIPATTAQDRQAQLIKLATKTGNKTGKRSTKKTRALAVAANSILNNAEILYVFSKGSPAAGQPARPVIEPAIVAAGNKEAIAYELAAATKAELDGNHAEAMKRLKRAGIAGSNAAKKWFTDSRNGWAPNAKMTIAAKGSDKPGIDTGAMRTAITNVVK